VVRRRLAAGILASLAGLTGCVSAASGAAPATSATTDPTSVPGPVAATVTSTSTSTTAPVPDLAGALDALWSHTPGGSCLVVSEGERVLYERNPDLPVVPASTLKLLTATAVLTRLDPNERLRTPVAATAAPDAGGVVHGDLWLVGGGDPLLSTTAYAQHFTRQPRLVTPIETLADRVVAAGVRHVTGRVMGDDGRHERVRYVPSWPTRYADDDETGPLSALSVNDGFETWAPAVPFADPAQGAAGVLNELLRQRGVVVDGDPASGAFPQGVVEVTSIDSPTIAELVQQMVRDSDNSTAEILLRELGLRVFGAGTTDNGRRAVTEALQQLGLPMAGVAIADGSGLDHGNRVTCRLLDAILTRSPVKDVVQAGLPVAAQTGTLYKRFLATPVAGHLRAKTGSVTGVAGLAGYADGAAEHRLTFAFIANAVGSRQGSELQDELGSDLVLRAP
jgi:D-alanyl-D-alanine carboxypeptidase/D-alanyl-D-alanine-endopeptidase (penicillin-binding protein 4)